MSYGIKYLYPNGEVEYEGGYETYDDAKANAEDGVLGFATGAEILDDMGESFIEGELDYEIYEE